MKNERIVVSPPKSIQVEINGVKTISLQGKQGIPGEKGDSYTLTEQDKQEIAQSITVPVVEKTVETVIKEIPIVTNEIVETIKEDIAPETLRDRLETLTDEERLSVTSIKYAVSRDELDALTARIQEGMNKIVGSGSIEVFNSTGKVGSGSALKFTGSGVNSVTNDGYTTTVNISGGGGGGTPASPTTSIQFNTAGAFDGTDKFTFDNATNTVNALSDYGSNLAPALTTGNWNLLTDWVYGTSPDSLIKSGATQNFAIKPTAATWIVAGTFYKVTFTVTALSGGSLTFSLGGIRCQYSITTTGTFSFFATSYDTSKFEINPNQGTVLCTITGISVTEVTTGTGEINAEGDVNARILKLQETIVSQSPRISLLASQNNWTPGGRPRSIYLLPNSYLTITGLFAYQVNGQEMFIKNFSAGTSVCFPHQSASSSVENRFSTNTGQDVYVHYGETLWLRYAGGAINRWLIEKISYSASQMNGATPFQDVLNTFVVNAEDLSIGTGNAGIRIEGTTGITRIGDHDNISTGTRIEVNDDLLTVKTYVNAGAGSKVQLIERGNDYYIDELLNEIDFASRLRQFSSKFLLTDSIGGNQIMGNDTVLVEFRTGGDNLGTYRGMLIPSMSSVSAEGIVAVGPADYLLFHNSDARISEQWDNNSGVWRSVGNYSGTHTASVTAQTTFTVTFPSATMPDTSYRVLVTAQNSLSATDFYVTNKTNTKFDIESVAGLTGDVAWDWLVTY